MIAKHQVMQLLLAACPSFHDRWNAYVADSMYDNELLYTHLSEFAAHLVDLMKRGALNEFPDVFDVVERLHLEGDAYVAEAATIGLLEGIQNIAGHSGVKPEAFVAFLKPESATWWRKLNDFWVNMSKRKD